MSTAASEEPGFPLIPQPANNPEDLRAAIAQVAPRSLAAFDAERTEALRQARETGSAAPMQRLVGQWAVFVAIERHPERAAMLRRLEVTAEQADTDDEALAAISAIGRILDQALAEAGLGRGAASR
ncbi:hypothetical protein IPZ58_17895 [Streptomyces roseoverticillatus]|uniref:DUF6247 family protein n=1 Tax=Streptomyces roseoverticillatus TaxID=66429 RepID=UPI001F1AE0EC|nr:DUF6247 family protein [Streptomyces roseoverticillatus]MCF3103439.1 hypothetical protein [Streptomyces roseoverticillatus]